MGGHSSHGTREGTSTSDADEILEKVAKLPAQAGWKAPGESFAAGRHVVKRVLGSGGQKIVYLVEDTVLQRDCALSVIHAADEAPLELERFRVEARALARFGAHPHVVTIHDLGDEDGRPYVVCEYLEGGDLRRLIAAGPPPVERALEIARDVALGLAFAHEHGIVHRDVKPANVWLTRDGRAKLGDFGLARLADGSRLTLPGDVLGTAAYMPPEQALGAPVDPRSDLYALGCVLHELVTGAPPFAAESPIAVAAQHVHAAPAPPSVRRPGLAAELDRLVMRLLAKRPEDRPRHALEVAAELDLLLATPREPARERARVAAVHGLCILDTPPEQPYDDLADLAAQVCGCAAGYVSFIDETRQWLKATCGMPAGTTAIPRELGVCNTTIDLRDVVVVPDLTADERFRSLPVVAGFPHLRFYCGAPIVVAGGHAVGTLCGVDFVPRAVTSAQVDGLRKLARQVVAQLELARVRAGGDPGRRAVEERPRTHPSVTVAVARAAGLGALAGADPMRLVATLDELFSIFDDIVAARGLERLRTAGDAYLFAGGLSAPTRRHEVDTCLAALEMRAAARRLDRARARLRLPTCDVRIGLGTGPAVAGAVGKSPGGYDMWGEAPMIAARLEAAAQAGAVLISGATHRRVEELFECGPGPAPDAHALVRIKPELSRDVEGLLPGDRFDELVRQRA